jgi:hypothetical protein
MTTEELLAASASNRDLRPDPPLLSQILSACDEVKFADATPSRSNVSDVLATARLFVEQSSQRLQLRLMQESQRQKEAA